MSEKFKPEAKEGLGRVKLEIIAPDFDKGYMVGFESRNDLDCKIYTDAMVAVLERAGLNYFVQIGGNNKAGYHACEIHSRNIERELLEGLIPQIEEEAQKIAKLYAK